MASSRNNHQVATCRTTPVSSSYSEYTERPSVYSFGHCRHEETELSRFALSPETGLGAHFPSRLVATSTGSGVRTRESLTDTWTGRSARGADPSEAVLIPHYPHFSNSGHGAVSGLASTYPVHRHASQSVRTRLKARPRRPVLPSMYTRTQYTYTYAVHRAISVQV